jgi:hypothetical protein
MVLLTEQRDERAAKRFLTKAIRRHGVPEKITIDGSAANEAAIKSYNEEHGTAITIRKRKYLNNVVEQDHRAVKRVTRPMLGFKSFDAAQDTLVGIELMHMIKKRQMVVGAGEESLTAAELFYTLAASSPHRQGQLFLHGLLSKICDRVVMPHWGTTSHVNRIYKAAIRCHSCTGREGLPPSWKLSYKTYVLRFTRESSSLSTSGSHESSCLIEHVR